MTSKQISHLVDRVTQFCPACGKIHEIEIRSVYTTSMKGGKVISYEEKYCRCKNAREGHENYQTIQQFDENLKNADEAYQKILMEETAGKAAFAK